VLPDLHIAARTPAADSLARLETSETGLSSAEAQHRLSEYGPNALRTHGMGSAAICSPALQPARALVAATLSGVVGSGPTPSLSTIVALSVGLFVNEYRPNKP
jgi:Mg2+-importing ATPase